MRVKNIHSMSFPPMHNRLTTSYKNVDVHVQYDNSTQEKKRRMLLHLKKWWLLKNSSILCLSLGVGVCVCVIRQVVKVANISFFAQLNYAAHTHTHTMLLSLLCSLVVASTNAQFYSNRCRAKIWKTIKTVRFEYTNHSCVYASKSQKTHTHTNNQLEEHQQTNQQTN